MTVLLDTHVFVWALIAPLSLSTRARTTIGSPGSVVLISAISIYEIAAKVRLGKWEEAAPLIEDIDNILRDTGYNMIDLTCTHALRAAALRSEHRDPFDRMLAATAFEEQVPILSADRAMDTFGVQRIW